MKELMLRLRTSLGDRYVVEEHLGSGGMAEVYRAVDVRHQRPVALKLLRPDVAATLGRERFLREIAIAASLSHPHILPLYDSGETEGLLYFVMPFVAGESLRTCLDREGQLPFARALELTLEIADGLHHAHLRGVIHRDIKPENVLLLSDHAVISDFGVARAVAAAVETRLTQAGLAVGTPAYMSPEQAFGEDAVDERSDLYSLACMTYEMLAGALPFAGPTVGRMLAMKSVERTLPPLPPATPRGVEAILRRAMAFDPAQRFADLPQFSEALREAAAGRVAERPDGEATLAVLPFSNRSADPDDEFLSDGLAEELIHALTRVPGIRVVARTSAFALKGLNEDVRVLGDRLGADLVLSGSVRRAGTRLRVTVQLVQVADGVQSWSERYDRDAGDAFVIQDEITAAILKQVVPSLGGPAKPVGQTANAKAYELYLRARHAWATRTGHGLHSSVTLFEQALAADPSFDLARAAESEALVTMGLYGEGRPEDTFGRAELVAREALEGSPDLVEARAALACIEAVYHWRWPAAEQAFAEALASNPHYATAHHWLAIHVLAPRGRLGEAKLALQQARFLDPLAPAMGLSAGLLEYFAGDWKEALAAFDGVLEAHERLAVAHYFAGLVLAEEGQVEAALERMQRAVESAPSSPESLGGLGYVLALLGREEAARRVLADLERLRSERYVSPVLDSQILVPLGEPDAALERLQAAEAVRAADLIWVGVRPTFRPLRGRAAFDRLVARLGLS